MIYEKQLLTEYESKRDAMQARLDWCLSEYVEPSKAMIEEYYRIDSICQKLRNELNENS